MLSQMDRDRDGTVTAAEIVAAQPDRTRNRLQRRVLELRELLAIDPNRDGRLTVQEYARYVEAVFDRWDTNGDWELDPAEQQAVRALRFGARERFRAWRRSR